MNIITSVAMYVCRKHTLCLLWVVAATVWLTKNHQQGIRDSISITDGTIDMKLDKRKCFKRLNLLESKQVKLVSVQNLSVLLLISSSRRLKMYSGFLSKGSRTFWKKATKANCISIVPSVISMQSTDNYYFTFSLSLGEGLIFIKKPFSMSNDNLTNKHKRTFIIIIDKPKP